MKKVEKSLIADAPYVEVTKKLFYNRFLPNINKSLIEYN